MSETEEISVSSDMNDEKEFEIMDSFPEAYKEYVKSAVKDNLLEMEVIYGTGESTELTKEQFLRCMRKLTESEKYVSLPEECSLDIRCQQVLRGKKVLTNIRASVLGLLNIKRYCMSESLEGLDVKMIKKTLHKDSKGNILNSLRNYAYNIRLNLKKELEVNHFSNNEAQLIKKKWNMMNKYFRYKKRYSFKSKDGLFRIDLTCVKQNKLHANTKTPIYTKTFREAEVLKSPERYELEIEYIGSNIPEEEQLTFTPKSTAFEDFISNMNTSINYYNTLSPFCSIGDGFTFEPYQDYDMQQDTDGTYAIENDDEYTLNSPKYGYDIEPYEALPDYVNINEEYLKIMGISLSLRNIKFIPFEKRSNYKPEGLSELLKTSLKKDDYYHVRVEPSIIKDDITINELWVPTGYTENITHHYIEKPFVSNGDKFNEKAYDELIYVLDDILKETYMYIENTPYILDKYMKEEILGRYVRTIDDDQYFKMGYKMIGPQPVTLTLREMNVNNPQSILQGYVVTEKADGIRAQLIVCKEDKRAYIVTAKRNVIDTGVNFEGVSESWIFDGEYITKDKNNNDIKLFMIFDVYKGQHDGINDIFNLPWISLKRDSKARSVAINEFFKKYEKSYEGDDYIRIECKTYIEGASKLQKKRDSDEYSNLYTTLKTCKRILDKCNSEGYEYVTDGLIFLPMYLPVKGTDTGEKVQNYNGTWNYNYKWKPPEENTIDFRVTFDNDKRFYTYDKKNEDGTINKIQYRKIVLTLGYKEKEDELIDFNMKFINKEKPNTKRYIHFNRGKDNSHICNVPLKNGKIICERDRLEITEGCIVEMRYNGLTDDGFTWTPLRVRTDKEFPQWFTIADNIWKTIINPVSELMITGEEELIVEEFMDTNKYYVSDNTLDNSTPIRHTHNLIKGILIESVLMNAGKDISILDTSCGRGGDNNKYLRVDKKGRNINFILGLDISDNVKEAANRYYHESLKRKVPKAIFLQYDTSKNIKNTEGCMNNTCEEMLNIIMGKTSGYDKKYENFYKNYRSLGKSGFDVVSSQFSFHYYFKNEETLRGYLQNLKELVKSGGYFMGTCYDGMKVMKLFDMNNGENIQAKDEKGVIIYDIIKGYNIIDFTYNKEDISNMLGQEISVYMSSIGQYITEYLVNFEFVINIMKEYGFEPVSLEKGDIKKPIGNFEELINKIDSILDDSEKDIQRAYLHAKTTQKDKKYRQLSELNNWFIFKKV